MQSWQNINDDLDEYQLWEKYPHHHKWWNKLYVAETFGYKCGPGGTPIPESKKNIVTKDKIKEEKTEEILN